MKTNLKLWFNEHYNEGVALLSDLVKQDTTNPPGNEYRAIEIVKKFLNKYNIPFDTYEVEPGRTNLLAKIGNKKPCVFVPAHTDVVPAGNGWNSNPFDPIIKDGFIYGRGVSDDKGPLVSVLLLAAFLKQIEDKLNGSILIGAVADEELGSEKGVIALLKANKIKADFAIVPDTGKSIFAISIGEKGMLRIKIKFFGTQAHASTPEKGLNAILAANSFISKINSLFKNEQGYFADDGNDTFSPSTINIAKITGGTAYNIVPNECEIFIDVRYTPNYSKNKIVDLINKIATDVLNQKLCNNFDITTEENMNPYIINDDSPLITSVKNAVFDLTNKKVSLFGMSGTTVCKQLVESGIPAIGFSLAAPGQAHVANEKLELKEIGLFGCALGLTLFNLWKS